MICLFIFQLPWNLDFGSRADQCSINAVDDSIPFDDLGKWNYSGQYTGVYSFHPPRKAGLIKKNANAANPPWLYNEARACSANSAYEICTILVRTNCNYSKSVKPALELNLEGSVQSCYSVSLDCNWTLYNVLN